jgi:hypothetical protein
LVKLIVGNPACDHAGLNGGEWEVDFAHGFGAFPTAEPWAFLGVGKSLFAVEGAARAGVAQTLQIDYNAGLT